MDLMTYGRVMIKGIESTTLPYAGIRTGEIIGHRLWWIKLNGLYSLAHDFKWEPGATIEGKLDQVVRRGISKTLFGGVYAYASRQFAELEINPMQHTINHYETIGHGPYLAGFALGTVKLWGDVIEHECGWRAQFAKLASIDQWWSGAYNANIPEILQPYYDSIKEKK